MPGALAAHRLPPPLGGRLVKGFGGKLWRAAAWGVAALWAGALRGLSLRLAGVGGGHVHHPLLAGDER